MASVQLHIRIVPGQTRGGSFNLLTTATTKPATTTTARTTHNTLVQPTTYRYNLQPETYTQNHKWKHTGTCVQIHTHANK